MEESKVVESSIFTTYCISTIKELIQIGITIPNTEDLITDIYNYILFIKNNKLDETHINYNKIKWIDDGKHDIILSRIEKF